MNGKITLNWTPTQDEKSEFSEERNLSVNNVWVCQRYLGKTWTSLPAARQSLRVRLYPWPLQKHHLLRGSRRCSALPWPRGREEGALAAEIAQPCPGRCRGGSQGSQAVLGQAGPGCVCRAGLQQGLQTNLSVPLPLCSERRHRGCPAAPGPERCQGLRVLAKSCGSEPRILLVGQIQQIRSCLRDWRLFCPLFLYAES